MIAALMLMLADAPTLLLACDGGAVQGGSYFAPQRYARSYRVQFRKTEEGAELYYPMMGSDEYRWIPVKDLRMGIDAITGKVKASMFGLMDFSIDRHTGTIQTAFGYSGKCEKVDPDARAF